jgi:hypothetical protein
VHRGYHAGWFHPLSLPLALIAVMSLAAPCWVYFTHESVGLIYATGYAPVDGSDLDVALSVSACLALALVVCGYMIGAATVLIVATAPAQRTKFERHTGLTDVASLRYRSARRAGMVLMWLAGMAQVFAAALERGTPYGVNQFQYGVPAILAPAAASALLGGLIVTQVASCRLSMPRSFREILGGVGPWFALGTYLVAVALTGGRGGLIPPLVYLGWAYSLKVHRISLMRMAIVLGVGIVIASVVVSYRDGTGLAPGSPVAIAQDTVDSVSSSAWLTEQTVLRVPEEVGYMHGSTYLAAVEAQLPGPLSRATGAPNRTASAVFRDIIDYNNPDQGFAESLPSEAYLNFGLIGCAGAGLVLGLIMGLAWVASEENKWSSREVWYGVLLAGLMTGFRADAVAQIKDILYPMLVVWVLLAWCRVAPGGTEDLRLGWDEDAAGRFVLRRR